MSRYNSRAMVTAEAATRAKVLDRLRLGDAAFRHMTRAAAIGVLVLLSAVIVSLIAGSLPALRTFGFWLPGERELEPGHRQIRRTYRRSTARIVTSFIAMLIAVPIGLMIAFFLTELCPQWLRRPIGTLIELLAAVPSIIYGIWGLFVLAPFLQDHGAALPDRHPGRHSRSWAYSSPGHPTASACSPPDWYSR